MPGITSTLKRNKVVTLGEVMMRLTTPGQARFVQSEKFNIIYAGAEANVAAALAHWGIHTSHITAFPHNDLGKSAAQYLREFGVDIDYIKFVEGRLGVYFIESGNTVRAPKVIYDRFNSCFANITGRNSKRRGVVSLVGNYTCDITIGSNGLPARVEGRQE
jgi:2-dehydro-3-deoxygluconokinase